MQDTQIVELYWARSQEAIFQSSEKYGSYCGSIAYNILRNHEDSEECVNDTWMQAWNAMPPQRPSFLKAFLGKITRNLALNCYEHLSAQKRGGSQIPLCLDELAECVADRDVFERKADEMVLKEVLNRFLSTLKEEDRRIFVQRYWYMRSVKELSEAFGCKESRIKMILLRSRNKLAGELRKEGISI